MALVNCKECGKLFQKTIGDSCPNCVKLRNTAIAKIDSYAFKHKEFSIDDLAKNVDMDPAIIKKYIAEGKVNSIKTLKAKCEMCGNESLVSTTTFLCKNCVSDIKSVQTTKEETQKPGFSRRPGGSRMRSRDD